MSAADVMINLEKQFDDPEAVITGHALISYDEYLALKSLMDDLGDIRYLIQRGKYDE